MTSIVRASLFVALSMSISGMLCIASRAQDGTAGSTNANAGKSAKQVSNSDRQFVKEAADGGMAEVELGQLATEKGSSSGVKKFGQRMVDDHSKANDQLKQIASEKGIQLPATPSAKNEKLKQHLSKLSGTDFDQAYMSAMVKDHREDVAAFQRESQVGNDPDIKQFAAETLPTLQDHLKQAESTGGGTMSRNANPMENQ